MKKLQNPTTYFFEQADNTPDLYRHEIEQFTARLLDTHKCPLCRQDYHLRDRLPRIMIHCGHSFCTPCLEQFYTNHRVRCPMCLKLVKHLDTIDRLPINHTIYSSMVAREQQACRREGRQSEFEGASQFLFGQFERVQREAHLKQNPQKYDPDSGLPFCIFHSDRVEHFYCETHKTFGCRVCIEVGHSREECQVTDLYTVENAESYHEMLRGQAASNQADTLKDVHNKFNFVDQQQIDGNLIDDLSSDEHRSV